MGITGKIQARQAILFHLKQALRAVFFTLSKRLGISVQEPGRCLRWF